MTEEAGGHPQTLAVEPGATPEHDRRDFGSQPRPEGQGMVLHAPAFRPGWCHRDHCGDAPDPKEVTVLEFVPDYDAGLSRHLSRRPGRCGVQTKTPGQQRSVRPANDQAAVIESNHEPRRGSLLR